MKKICCFALLVIGMACFIPVLSAGEGPDKSTIFQLFKDMETAWNAADSDAYIEFFHQDLNLKLGKKSAPKYYTRAEYAKELPGRIKKFGPFRMVEPKILELDGDKAKASVIVRKKTRDYPNTFNLVWEGGRWQILSNEW